MTFGDPGPSVADRFRMENKFVAAKIDHGDSQDGFGGSGQYSFFGNLDDVDGGLEGGLEEGIDAPPEEEGLPVEEDLGLTDPDFAATSDLGLATMLGGLEIDYDNGLGVSDMRLDGMVSSAPLSVANAVLEPGRAPASQRAASPAGSLSKHGISPIASVETQISAHQSLQAAAGRPLDPVAIMRGVAVGGAPQQPHHMPQPPRPPGQPMHLLMPQQPRPPQPP
eukprot:CAMPEP_0117684966 /NCGR_PEP_ID=MMETSP0804-20121206/21455_1 /TAXON_ID=1074897 /ORGANISM="Tetraselmis astigmatica, Strain CCMP880" /LENGTH=222 /DNA_ID=CAMNT_0005496141 /DNA_START=56 /DNA_END=721 /DNA_ORIENTATION=+